MRDRSSAGARRLQTAPRRTEPGRNSPFPLRLGPEVYKSPAVSGTGLRVGRAGDHGCRSPWCRSRRRCCCAASLSGREGAAARGGARPAAGARSWPTRRRRGTVAVRAEGRRDFVTEFLAPLEPSPPLSRVAPAACEPLAGLLAGGKGMLRAKYGPRRARPPRRRGYWPRQDEIRPRPAERFRNSADASPRLSERSHNGGLRGCGSVPKPAC